MCALFFISVADAWEAPLSLSGFSGKEWWKKLDMDVRATLHLDAGYPLSKHRTQLANESDQQTHSEKQGCFLREWYCTRCLCNKALSFVWLLVLLFWKEWEIGHVGGLRAEVACPAVRVVGLWLVTLTVGTGAPQRCRCFLWAAVLSCVHIVTSHRSHRPSALLPPGPHSSVLFVYRVSPLLMSHFVWTSD